MRSFLWLGGLLLALPLHAQTTKPQTTKPHTHSLSAASQCDLRCAKHIKSLQSSRRKQAFVSCVKERRLRTKVCHEDLIRLQKHMKEKWEREEAQCKGYCQTNEPCFSACTIAFSEKAEAFDKTYSSLLGVCEAWKKDIAHCLPKHLPPQNIHRFFSCKQRCQATPRPL